MTGAYLPLSTHAEHYGPFPALDYTYQPGVTAVIGQNGAGKSYLVNAPAVALFGHTPDGVSFGELLTNTGGADRMTVLHEFAVGGERYRVRRSWSAKGCGKTTLDLEHNKRGSKDLLSGENMWVPLPAESIRQTQAEIERLLGFTCETFLASALQLQNGASFASRQTSRVERCDLLMTGLGLQYDQYRVLAERDRKAAEKEASRLTDRVEQAEQELVEKAAVSHAMFGVISDEATHLTALEHVEQRLEALLDEQRQAEQRVSERRAAEAEHRAAGQKRNHLRAQAQAAEAARDSITAAKEQLASLASQDDVDRAERDYRDALAHLERVDAERKALEERLNTTRARCDTVMAEENRLIAQSKDIRARADALHDQPDSDEACPTCKRPLDDPEARHRVIEAYWAELSVLAGRIDEIRREWNDLYDEVCRIEEDLGREEPTFSYPSDLEVRRAREQVAERIRLEERVSAWQQATENAPTEGQMAAAETAYETMTAALAVVQVIDQAEHDRIQRQTLEARARVNEQRQRLDQARAEKARLEAQLERLQQVEAQAAEDRLSLSRAREAAVLASRMEQMYGRDGIPALVIEAVAVPYLEAEATRILHRLGKPWTVEIHLGKETKKGETRPALDVKVVTDTGAVQRYEQCSGGEQMRLDIALHVAFVRLWKQRNGSWSELYAIDEPEGLDASGMSALVDVLDFLGEEFEVVQLVSHHSELRDSIGQVVQVVRDGGRSRVDGAAAPAQAEAVAA